MSQGQPSADAYKFEMTDMLAVVMSTVAEQVRTHGHDALDQRAFDVKREARTAIFALADENQSEWKHNPSKIESDKTPQEIYDIFCTSYDKACNAVKRGTFTVTDTNQAMYPDHDGAMESPTNFRGRVVKEVHSGENMYLMYKLEETFHDHEICNCPSQRYHLWCKHSIANVIARNLPEHPDALQP